MRADRWLLVPLGALLLVLGVSGVSLWIDEAYSAKLAVQPSLSAWASTLNGMHGSDSQMPGYYLYLWFWAGLFGRSELALRLANAPWALVFTASLAWGATRVLKIRRLWLIICLSPFMWYYMNEARPYAMMMGLSMITTIAVFAYARDPQRFNVAPWWAMISLAALWFSQMLAILLAPSLIVILLITQPMLIKRHIRQWLWPTITTLPIFFVLALYYLRTLLSGKGGMIEQPGLRNLLFAVYEILGFGGLGPPRNVLRQSPSVHTIIDYLPSVGLGALALGIVALAILLQWRNSLERRSFIVISVAIATGLLFTFVLSYAAHFRLLGRHMAAFVPLFALLLLTGLLAESIQPRCKVAWCALVVLGIAWSVSDVRLRFLPSYQKDDYRDAAELALNALGHGEPVLWVADREAAKYYGLRTTGMLESGSASRAAAIASVSGYCPAKLFAQSLQNHRMVLVVMNDKPDLFDHDGRCQRAMKSLDTERVASFSAFEAWQVTGRKNIAGRF